MTAGMETKKVLSIQSHVVHGYVGNKLATFPLQIRGWDVDALNTVNFSNHPGYGKFKGTKTSASELEDIFQGLMEIDCQYDAILTGYIPGLESLRSVYKMCKEYLEMDHVHSDKVLWVLDPVLGDNGKLYVSGDILPIYQEMLKSGLIDLITPNQFEMELLVDTKIETMQDLHDSFTKFHQMYKVKNVVVTSVYLQDKILCCGSSSDSTSFFYYEVTQIDAKFSGSGDLFSAVLTDSFYRNCHAVQGLETLLGETLTKIEKVLKISYDIKKTQLSLSLDQDGEISGQKPIYVKDLNVVQSRQVFLSDEIAYIMHTESDYT